MATSKFGKAFAAARKAGKKEFSFGGKKYNTKLKGEGGSSAKVPTPTKRPQSQSDRAKARGQVKPGMVEARGQRDTDAYKAGVAKERAAKRGQQGPAAPKKEGIARKGSLISSAAAAEANKPKAREKADYPRPAKAVGIARKGSPISKAAARRENAPKKK